MRAGDGVSLFEAGASHVDQRSFPRRVDETSPTAWLSVKVPPVNLDLAYVRNMARSRVDELFGTQSNSILATVTVDYGAIQRGH